MFVKRKQKNAEGRDNGVMELQKTSQNIVVTGLETGNNSDLLITRP